MKLDLPDVAFRDSEEIIFYEVSAVEMCQQQRHTLHVWHSFQIEGIDGSLLMPPCALAEAETFCTAAGFESCHGWSQEFQSFERGSRSRIERFGRIVQGSQLTSTEQRQALIGSEVEDYSDIERMMTCRIVTD